MEDRSDEAPDLSTVAQDWINGCSGFRLRDVPVAVLIFIAKRFLPLPDLEWMKLCVALGVDDQQTINEIKGDSIVKQKWPSEILLLDRANHGILTDLMFGDVIEALLNMGNLKVLQELYDSRLIRDFLDKKPAPLWDFGKEPKRRDLPEAIYDSRPIVFLTYSDDAKETAHEVEACFHKENIGVVTEAFLEEQNILQLNPTRALQEYVNEQVQLVIPIISKQYLIDIKNSSKREGNCSVNNKYVQFVYELYTNKFVSDGCLNRRVRALVVPEDGPSPGHLNKLHLTLGLRWKLWSQWEPFMKVVRQATSAKKQIF